MCDALACLLSQNSAEQFVVFFWNTANSMTVICKNLFIKHTKEAKRDDHHSSKLSNCSNQILICVMKI